jgi:anti-anti-sigma factor
VPSEGLRVTADRRGDWTVLAVAGELDLATADEFAAAVREQLAGNRVLLDLRELSFMDSSGVRVLDALQRDVERGDRNLAIRGEFQDNVRMVLEMTGMLGSLPIREEP